MRFDDARRSRIDHVVYARVRFLVSRVSFARPLGRERAGVAFNGNVFWVEVDRGATVDSSMYNVRVVRIVTNIQLKECLERSPCPFLVKCVVGAFMLNDDYRRYVTYADSFDGFYDFFPLSNRRMNADRGTISSYCVQLRLLIVAATGVIFRVVLHRIRVIGGALMGLYRYQFSFQCHLVVAQFNVGEGAEYVLVLRVNGLVVLCRVRVTRDARYRYLSLCLSRFFQVPLSEGNDVAVVCHFVCRVPNGLYSAIQEGYCVVGLVQEVGAVFQAKGGVAYRRVVRALGYPVAGVNVNA